MVGHFTNALNATHDYLNRMGARVAPDKSHNFASHPKAKAWLSEMEWKHIKQRIQVETDFRYLGANITTKASMASATLDQRFEKASSQLKRLRFCPAGVEAKVSAILAKIYAGALYGIEAAQVTPAKFAKLSASVIDAFRSKNDNHNADKFYATISEATKDLDPVTQTFCRRAMQIRRTCHKQSGAKCMIQGILGKYVDKHSVGQQKPRWHHCRKADQEEDEFKYPPEQPHPSTKEHQAGWNDDLSAQGPVGLLIELILWNGMAIDDDLKIWQKGEPPIDLINAPYQSLKVLLMNAAVRARTRAEWNRDTENSASREIREIDRELSQVDKDLTADEKKCAQDDSHGREPSQV